MSRRERERLTTMLGVRQKELTLVQASTLLGLSYRQTKRVWWRVLPGRPEPAPPKPTSGKVQGVKPPGTNIRGGALGWGRDGPTWRGVKRKRSEVLGAPIRAGGASPLRVATGGDANWSSQTVAAARPAA